MVHLNVRTVQKIISTKLFKKIFLYVVDGPSLLAWTKRQLKIQNPRPIPDQPKQNPDDSYAH